jgi:ATP-dependent DNA helicase RecG
MTSLKKVGRPSRAAEKAKGAITKKAGADKRRVNSKEELRRLFQITDQFHADELPTRAGLDALDELRFRRLLA